MHDVETDVIIQKELSHLKNLRNMGITTISFGHGYKKTNLENKYVIYEQNIFKLINQD